MVVLSEFQLIHWNKKSQNKNSQLSQKNTNCDSQLSQFRHNRILSSFYNPWGLLIWSPVRWSLPVSKCQTGYWLSHKVFLEVHFDYFDAIELEHFEFCHLNIEFLEIDSIFHDRHSRDGQFFLRWNIFDILLRFEFDKLFQNLFRVTRTSSLWIQRQTCLNCQSVTFRTYKL